MPKPDTEREREESEREKRERDRERERDGVEIVELRESDYYGRHNGPCIGISIWESPWTAAMLVCMNCHSCCHS